MWLWWWNSQGEDLKDLIQHGDGGEINLLGDAAGLDMRDQDLEVAGPQMLQYRSQFSKSESESKAFPALRMISAINLPKPRSLLLQKLTLILSLGKRGGDLSVNSG